MAEMRSPIQGGIDQARRSFSASSLGGGSTIVAYNPTVADNNESKQLLQQNQLTLQQISGTIVRVGSQMDQLNNNLVTISNLVSQSSTLENIKEQQRNNQERQLAEQQLREGKESIIERKMQSALQSPVQKVGQKAQFALSGLMSFFNQLFFGWLLYQGIETIKALSEGNTEKLEQIKDTVIDNLKKVGSVLFVLSGGLGRVFNALRSVGLLFFRIVNLGILKKPITALWNSLNSIGKRLGRILPPAIKRILKLGAGAADDAARALGSPAAMANLAFAGVGAYLGYKENVSEGMEPTTAAAAAGTATGAGAIAATLVKGPWWMKAIAGGLTYSAVNDAFKGNLNFGINSIFGDNQNEMKDGGDQLSVDKKREFNAVEQPSGDSKKPDQMKAAEVSSVSRQDAASKIGQEPTPAPTIAFLPAPEQKQQQTIPSGIGIANRVPNVRPSNPDNFYSHFSMTQYQVV